MAFSRSDNKGVPSTAVCRSSARSGFGFARRGRLHRGEQECNAEVGRYPRRRWLFWNVTRRIENTELSPWNDIAHQPARQEKRKLLKDGMAGRSGAAFGSAFLGSVR